MRTFLRDRKQRLYSAIDLGIELLTLGGYGLAEVESDTPPRGILGEIGTTASRHRHSGTARPAPFDVETLAL